MLGGAALVVFQVGRYCIFSQHGGLAQEPKRLGCQSCSSWLSYGLSQSLTSSLRVYTERRLNSNAHSAMLIGDEGPLKYGPSPTCTMWCRIVLMLLILSCKYPTNGCLRTNAHKLLDVSLSSCAFQYSSRSQGSPYKASPQKASSLPFHPPWRSQP
jgi:hypothetical protein